MNMEQINEECRIERERVYRYLDEYWRHATVLRAWFVSFGVGAFVFLIAHPECFQDSQLVRSWFMWLSGVGVILQIVLTLLNKIAHWYKYYGENLKSFQKTKRFQWSTNIVECFWVDLILDIITFICYATAAVLLMLNT